MKKISRRDFLKISSIIIVSAAVTKIPLPQAPYKLPYWKDVMEVGVYRWNKIGHSLMVDGIECDPVDDFCNTGEGKFLSTPRGPGTILFNFTPEKAFFDTEKPKHGFSLIGVCSPDKRQWQI